MEKPINQRAWLMVLPVLLLVAFSAIIPLMTVVNYSVQDIFGPNERYFVGTEWFQEVLHNHRSERRFGGNSCFPGSCCSSSSRSACSSRSPCRRRDGRSRYAS